MRITLTFSLISLITCFDIYPTKYETVLYSLEDMFGQLQNPIYEIYGDQLNNFKIVDSISLLDSFNHSQAQIKYFRQNMNCEIFSFLDSSNILYWTDKIYQSLTPFFSHSLQLNNTSFCFSFDYINETTLLIDCIDENGINQFFFVSLNTDQAQFQLSDQSSFKYSDLLYRKINVLNDNYFLVGSQSDTQSLIEVFNINSVKKESYLLNTETIVQLAQIESNTYQFKLIDFYVRDNSLIYVLDEQRIFLFNYNKQWILLQSILLPAKAVSFDVNFVSDINGNEKFYMPILLENSSLMLMNNFSLIDQEILSIQGQFVQVSNQYIIIQQQQELIVLDQQSKKIITKKIFDNNIGHWLVNPFNPSLLILYPTFIEKYLISSGYLYSHSNETTQNLQQIVIQAQLENSSKEIYLSYKVINSGNEELYLVSSPNLFSNGVYSQYQTSYVNNLISGPDQIFNQVQNNDTSIEIAFQTVIVQQIKFPNSIIYSDLVMLSETNFIYVFQLEDLSVLFYQCVIKFHTDDCIIIGRPPYRIKSQLSKLNFQIWINDEQYYYAISQLNDISIFLLNTETIIHISDHQIQQFLVLKNYIFILLDNGEVYIYQNQKFVERIALSSPILKLYGNPYHNSEIVVLYTENCLTIIRYYKTVQFIQIIRLNNVRNVAISEKTMMVVTPEAIIEFYINLSGFQQLKYITLEGYQIEEPDCSYQSKHNGLLFVLASKNEQNYMLILKPNQLTHNLLYKSISLEPLIALSNIIICADGNQITELFYHDQQSQFHLLVMENIEAIVTNISLLNNNYYTLSNINLTVSNSQNTIFFTESIGLLNTMEKVSILGKSENEIYLGQNDFTQVFNLGNDWYSGQVVDFEIQCRQCPQEVNINHPIYSVINNLFGNAQIIKRFDTSSSIIVTDSLFIIADNSQKIISKINLQNICYDVAINNIMGYIILSCNEEDQTILVMIICHSLFSCFIFKSEESIYFPKIQQMEINNDNLLIIAFENEIQIQQVKFSLNNWNLIKQQVILPKDYCELCEGVNYFTISQIQTENVQSYLVSILDKQGYIIFLFTIMEENKYSIQHSQIQLLYQKIQENQQYALPTTNYIQLIQISEIEKDEQQNLIFTCLLISETTAIYSIQFSFNQLYQNISTSILYIINQYSDWRTLNKVVLEQNRLIVLYTNSLKYTLLYYILPEQLSEVITITSIGGLEEIIHNNNFNPVVCIYRVKTGFQMLSNLKSNQNQHFVTQYSLYTGPFLIVQNYLNLDKDQIINIVIKNDFSSSNQNIVLKEELKPIDDSFSIAWMIIISIIILIFGVLLIIYVKRRRLIRSQYQNTQYQQMQEHQIITI